MTSARASSPSAPASRPTNGTSPISTRAWTACAQVEAELGPVDVLVNNAGITRDTTMKRMDHQQVAGGDRHQSRRLLQHGQGGVRGHDRARLGPDRQHRLDQRPGRAIWPGQLCRRQVGHPRLHQGAGAGRRAQRRDRQRDRAGLYRHRHGRRGARGSAGQDRRQDPRRPARQGERDRARRRVPVSTRMPASSPARRCRSTAASICTDGASATLRPSVGDDRRARNLDQPGADVLAGARSAARGARTAAQRPRSRGSTSSGSTRPDRPT